MQISSSHVEAIALMLLHVLVIAGVGVRVILTRHAPGSSFAWLLLTAVLPGVGALLYLLIGERPIGRRRTEFARGFFARLPAAVDTLSVEERADPASLAPPWDGLARLATESTGMPLMARSRFSLLDGAEPILRAIIADVDSAQSSVEMEFYIWNAGGTADEVAAALARAVQRGVRVQVLLDAMGSKEFLKTDWPQRMRSQGIDLQAALAVKPWRVPFRRIDLRLHRKIVVVDGRIGYTGSMNLVDPRFFRKTAGVGEWVDAMARAEGPIVGALRTVFLFDWGMQTGQMPAHSYADHRADWAAAGGTQVAQVVMSGPGADETANLRVITQAIASARGSVVLTTPYFVADAALALALENAALRGCEVTLIVPARNDSWLVEYASRWFFEDLSDAGVRILRYTGGLLHTKSITVDGAMALFGTANLDIRSLALNFELMVAIYDAGFAAQLLELQRRYEQDSLPIVVDEWRARPLGERLKEGFAFMAAPLL
ncbi:MAG: cardiolipin synthase [Gammaproteobacteria bacterium]|nr:cardiolipin synthase [Gammaproteobacteria bacterium]